MPTHSQPRVRAAFAVARMTAFSPGQSPPPVTTPIFVMMDQPKQFCNRRNIFRTCSAELLSWSAKARKISDKRLLLDNEIFYSASNSWNYFDIRIKELPHEQKE